MEVYPFDVVLEVGEVGRDGGGGLDARGVDLAGAALGQHGQQRGPQHGAQVRGAAQPHGLVHHLRHQRVAAEDRRRVAARIYEHVT